MCFYCDVSCDSCQGPSNADCLKCSSNYFLYEGKCLNNCPDGMIRDLALNDCIKLNKLDLV